MECTEKVLEAAFGIRNSSGRISDFPVPITSLMAVKSNPARRGRASLSFSLLVTSTGPGGVPGVGGGDASCAVGVPGRDDMGLSSRGGISSSSTPVLDEIEELVRCENEGKWLAVGGRET